MRSIAFVFILAVSAAAFAGEYPGKNWQRIANPGVLGWSPSGLDRFRNDLKDTQVASVFVVYSGKELFEYGDVHKPEFLASARKSLLSALYGKYVASGKIKLDSTLADLGIDDNGGLSAKEKQATVRDLLQARSGLSPGGEQGRRPRQGAAPRFAGARHLLRFLPRLRREHQRVPARAGDVIWQAGDVAKVNAAAARPLMLTMLASYVAVSVITVMYFFAAPIVFSVIVCALIAWAWLKAG